MPNTVEDAGAPKVVAGRYSSRVPLPITVTVTSVAGGRWGYDRSTVSSVCVCLQQLVGHTHTSAFLALDGSAGS